MWNTLTVYREFVKFETRWLFIENLLNVKHIDYLQRICYEEVRQQTRIVDSVTTLIVIETARYTLMFLRTMMMMIQKVKG